MVKENGNTNINGDFPNFIDKKISCVPLNGDYYEADCHTVHQELVSFKTIKPSGD